MSMLLTISAARADTLVTMSGRQVEGAASVGTAEGGAAGILIKPAASEAVAVPLEELFSLTRAGSPDVGTGARVHLVDGTIVPAKVLKDIEKESLRGTLADDRTVSIPTTELAGVDFDGSDKLPPAPGAYLRNGDVFQGSVAGLRGSEVKLRSTLFGERKFKLADVRALVWRNPKPGAAQFVVRLTDGTLARCDALSAGHGMLTLCDPPFFPSRTVAMGEILSIMRPPEMTKSLPSGECGPGQEFVVHIPPGTRGLMASVRISPEVLPVSQARVVAVAEGQEVYRSPVMTSLSDGAQVVVGVEGKREVRFRVDASVPVATRAEVNEIHLIGGGLEK